ncbi:MAG: DUF3892 domain-containing protein [Syntrophomonadaceae bacterium]|nr:DUF3892 domain-containing protein [Syntrophomonadaceae bacterium]
MPTINQVEKNAQGDITGVRLDDGRILSITQAIEEAERGNIKGVFVGTAVNGQKYLRTRRGDDADDNLDSLSLM